MRNQFIRKIILCFLLLPGIVQTVLAIGISGPTCVTPGVQYTYSITGTWSPSTSMTWSVSAGGTIIGSSSGTPFPNVTIKWTSAGSVTLITSNPAGNTSLSVTLVPGLTAGTISNPTQNIAYGATPSSIICNASSGGSCSTPTYVYQWQQSSNNVNFTPVGGSAGAAQSLTFSSGITATTYYRRMVTETSSNSTAYTSSATVFVYPQLIPGSVSPATKTINYNTNSGLLTLSGVSGGNGTYSYQWQSSVDGTNWGNISGATSTTYTSGNLTMSTYLRVVVSSVGQSAGSNVSFITVNPQVLPGNIVPAGLTISSGTSPGILSANPASGGACGGGYSYQWQNSTDGVNFSDIGGANGLVYTTPALSTTTYYRRKTTCGTDIEYTDICKITIGSPVTNLGYLRVRDISKPGVPDVTTADGLTSTYDVKQTTQYFDGLGRSVQTVSKQISPLGKDLVSVNVYDVVGRESLKYLPYVSSSADGLYKTNPMNDASVFNSSNFPDEQFYYGQINYEPSPLNRPSVTLAPGNSWIGGNRGVSSQYQVNTVADSVRFWIIATALGSIPTTSATYLPGTLFKSIVIDEQGHRAIEFKDMQGKLVLKRVQLSSAPGTAHMGWLNTYYIYDDMDNLRFVIQPGAIDLLESVGNWNLNGLTNLTNEMCFRYEYDERNRMIIKKIPGADEMWMVYDGRDRLVMTQDANLRTAGKWLVTSYDVENRVQLTGLLTDANTRTYHQNLAGGSTTYPTTASNFEKLTQTFYDDYSWVSGTGTSMTSTIDATYTSNSTYFITSYNVSPVYAQTIVADYRTRGIITGSMSKVIGTASQYLFAESFYDDRGRTIETQSVNYTGGLDESVTQYDFSGKLLRSLQKQQKNGANAQTHFISTKMNYDAAERLLTVNKNIDNSGADQLIVTNTYNELGQLQNKALGNSIENLAYDYNIRGWLKTINKNYVSGSVTTNYFGMELGYDKSTSVNTSTTYTTTQFNGNIAGTIWRSAGDGVGRKYDFQYDNVNRLTSANFVQNSSGTNWDNGTVDFTANNISYDGNGNILTMNQKGFKVGGSALIDQLTYIYQANSNKLSIVNDAVNDANSKLADFHYTSKHSVDYTYDGNGNLIVDNNRTLLIPGYNYLNLAEQLTVTGKGTIAYTYDANGNKLKKVTTDNTVVPTKTNTTLYLGESVYVNDTLQLVAHEEGRARLAYHKYLNGSTAYKIEYDYFVKDHLGNTRVVLTQQKDTAQYIATMEAAYRATETQLFNNITNTSYKRALVSGYPNDVSVTNPNDSVAKVNGSVQKTGPSILLKVMSGDKLDIAVQSYYNAGTNTSQNSSVTDVLNSFANGIVTMAGGSKGSAADLNNTGASPIFAAINSFLPVNEPDPGTTKPKAYLNWILLDEQLKYVSSYPQSGAAVVGASSTLNTIGYTGLPITKSGYLYIWVSNETVSWDVFFDNLSIKHYTGPLLEETHYYPFGLEIAGLSTKALKSNYYENRRKYNGGSELQHKEFSDGSGLELYTTNYRMYDPQIGRFDQIDPLSEINENASTYTYANNNPILYNDPLGLLSDSSHPQNLATVTVTPQKKNNSNQISTLPLLQTKMATDNVNPTPRPNPNIQNMRIMSAEEANKGFKEPPYARGTRVTEYRTTMKQKFVRVFNPGNKGTDPTGQGKWLMKESDIQGLKPEQIQERFAIPGENAPTEIVEVEVPAGTLMRVGYAGTNSFGTGGGVQFELVGRIPGSAFSAPALLPTPSAIMPETVMPETTPFEEPFFPEEPIIPFE